MKWLFVATLASVAVAVGLMLLWQQVRDDMLGRAVPDSAAGTLIVAPGTSFREFARELAARGIVDDALYLRLLARLDDRVGMLQAGEYALAPEMTVRELLSAVAMGDVILHDFTIVEGWSFRELREAMARHPVIEHDPQVPHEALMAAIGLADEHPEGWFLPETYRFPRGTSDEAFLGRAHRAMRETLDTIWAERDDGIPLDSPYEALIMASLIEKETGVGEERQEISGVFARRLNIGMRLQTDPTVIYGMGDAYDGRIRTRDLRTDTAYNTYTRHGLPPTPIAMPGRAALEAAVSPADGTTLYFVSRGDGTHQFSETLEEHNRAVRRYILGEEP